MRRGFYYGFSKDEKHVRRVLWTTECIAWQSGKCPCHSTSNSITAQAPERLTPCSGFSRMNEAISRLWQSTGSTWWQLHWTGVDVSAARQLAKVLGQECLFLSWVSASLLSPEPGNARREGCCTWEEELRSCCFLGPSSARSEVARCKTRQCPPRYWDLGWGAT